MPRIATIGVYEWDAQGFLAALDEASVTKVLDVRQRRGVRGPHYTWANAQRLQALLAGAGVAYEHHPELAPDTAMRQAQYRADKREGVGKRSRGALSAEYTREYTGEILDVVPLEPFVRRLPVQGIAALMCVETDAAACHRSLIAGRLADQFGFDVVDLEPGWPAEFDLA